MQKKYLSLFILLPQFLIGQVDIFTGAHTETLSGQFNVGRVKAYETLAGGTSFESWNASGTVGLSGSGEVWHSFARYKMFERDLFNKVDAATSITWTTGLWSKELNRTLDPENGGLDVDVYLALDPAGWIVPNGEAPGFDNAFDWADELGFGWDNTVYLGRILQSEPMATAEEKESDRVIPVDSPAMRLTFDMTDAIKDWISSGLLTDQSTVAVGLVQRGAVISDGQGNPKFDDPQLYLHQMMGFSMGTSFIKTEVSDTPKAPPPFDQYDLVDGYVDTGSWLGWVYVELYPWSYIDSLGKWAYVTDPAGWIYIPK